MSEPRISTLIVDLDGVIRHWHVHEFNALAIGLGLRPEDLGAIAFEPGILDAGMTGALTYEAWAEEIGRRTAARHGSDASAVAAGFTALGWSVDEEVVALLRKVRAAGHVRLALFSNASTRLESELASCGLDVEFDVVFNSSRLGMAKPDPEAFLMVARRLGVPPERCLFVDDRVANVDGARLAGMHAEQFRDVTSLRAVLERAQLLDAAAGS